MARLPDHEHDRALHAYHQVTQQAIAGGYPVLNLSSCTVSWNESAPILPYLGVTACIPMALLRTELPVLRQHAHRQPQAQGDKPRLHNTLICAILIVVRSGGFCSTTVKTQREPDWSDFGAGSAAHSARGETCGLWSVLCAAALWFHERTWLCRTDVAPIPVASPAGDKILFHATFDGLCYT